MGRGGRHTLSALLPGIRSEFNLDVVCVQGENAAGGFGITLPVAKEIFSAGADVITSGNHIWDKKEIFPYLKDENMPILRPLNYPNTTPGRGALDIGAVVVMNLIGRVFLGSADCPFIAADTFLSEGLYPNKPIIVDIHAEASSEKQAMAWHLDGRVSAICGTHTHVPTADARIFPNGTAFVGDIGMVGAVHSIVGMSYEASLQRFLTGIPERLKPVERGLMQFNSVLIEVDPNTLKSTNIERVDRFFEI